MFEQPTNRSVAGLVVGDGAFFVLSDYLALLLQAADNPIHSSQEVLLIDGHFVVTSCNQRGLVADVGDVGTRETGSLTSQEINRHIVGQFEATHMYFENILALFQLGQAHVNLSIKPTCTHQRLVEYIHTVGCGQHNDTRIGTKTVHLRQELVESILPLVVATEARILAPCTTNSVNLINKDNAGSLLLCLSKQISHPRCTNTHKHLHEVATANREKWYVGLSCHSLGKQRFTRSGRAYKQSTLGNLTTEFAVFIGLTQKIDNLHNLHLSLLVACDILECDAVFVVLIVNLRLRLTHVHNAVLATCTSRGRAKHCNNHHKEENHWQDAEDVAPNVLLVIVAGCGDLHAILLAQLSKVGAEDVGIAHIVGKLVVVLGQRLKGGLFLQALDSLVGKPNAGHLIVDNHNALHLTRYNQTLNTRPVGLGGSAIATGHLHKEQTHEQ